MSTTLSPAARLAIIEVHAEHGAPFDASVLFLLKQSGFTVKETAGAIGISREMFNKALRGDRRVTPGLRQVVTARLGIDPWEVYARHHDLLPGLPQPRRTQP